MMDAQPLHVVRRPEKLLSDDKRVIPRHLDFRDPSRVRAVVRRVRSMADGQVSALLDQVKHHFAWRHCDIDGILREHFRRSCACLGEVPSLPEDRQLLVGAYFTMEYSIEAAALFNPSIVPHPDQSRLGEGEARFLMSLRATGEGHVSSIVFRRGVLGASGDIRLDPPPRRAFTTPPVPAASHASAMFCHKLDGSGADAALAKRICRDLPDPFTLDQLRIAIHCAKESEGDSSRLRRTASRMLWIARASYSFRFPPDAHPAEMVIFPATEWESRGMEDLRLVRFADTDGTARYYGTYTALGGRHATLMMLETTDFHIFHVAPLTGRYARNKGMALFPRKVGGCYLMVSRHDGQNLFLLHSHDPHAWNHSRRLHSPAEPWEFLQIGNCGSPLETESGWILLTHGVGPMRQYAIGALLLDLENPTHVLGRLREPLLAPAPDEREGYVPNVVYSCGSMIHNGRVVIPYAMSDSRTSFASVVVGELVDRLLHDGP